MGSGDSMPVDGDFSIEVEGTSEVCPVGQKVGKRNLRDKKIPVLSCEGACLRGEIARLAANLVAKEEGFARGCHGELLTVPGSGLARWMKESKKVVLVDGCFLHCHERILKNLFGENQLTTFDALSHYGKYTNLFNIDDVPEAERKQVARDVADWVLSSLRKGANI